MSKIKKEKNKRWLFICLSCKGVFSCAGCSFARNCNDHICKCSKCLSSTGCDCKIRKITNKKKIVLFKMLNEVI